MQCRVRVQLQGSTPAGTKQTHRKDIRRHSLTTLLPRKREGVEHTARLGSQYKGQHLTTHLTDIKYIECCLVAETSHKRKQKFAVNMTMVVMMRTVKIAFFSIKTASCKNKGRSQILTFWMNFSHHHPNNDRFYVGILMMVFFLHLRNSLSVNLYLGDVFKAHNVF